MEEENNKKGKKEEKERFWESLEWVSNTMI